LRKKRAFKITALAVTAGILIILGIGMGLVYRGQVLLPSIPLFLTQLDVRADNVLYTNTDGDGRRWILEADTAQYDRASQKALLKQVRVRFYKQDEELLYLTANSGELQVDHNIMTVHGDVVARSAPQTILRTESLIYQGKTGMVITHDPVDLETTRMHIKGVGMTLDLSSQRMEIHRSVQSWMMGT
jgi:LPS export ABC transporter protein LptC